MTATQAAHAARNGSTDTRPRVALAMPCGGTLRLEAATDHFARCTSGKCWVQPMSAVSSSPFMTHNSLWAVALSYHKHGILDYFCVHHADVEVRTHGWVDVMVDEMRRVGAAILSAVIAIKDDQGITSTAVEGDTIWTPRRLSLVECHSLPQTFSAADTPWPDRALLVNTGLVLFDLSRPEFYAANDDGSLQFLFEEKDRIIPGDDGMYRAEMASDDWNLSRTAYRHGLPVYATWKVHVEHWGSATFGNQPQRKAS